MAAANLVEKYTYRVGWSEEDNTHIAYCLEFPSLAAYVETVADALSNIVVVVSESIKWFVEKIRLYLNPWNKKNIRAI